MRLIILQCFWKVLYFNFTQIGKKIRNMTFALTISYMKLSQSSTVHESMCNSSFFPSSIISRRLICSCFGLGREQLLNTISFLVWWHALDRLRIIISQEKYKIFFENWFNVGSRARNETHKISWPQFDYDYYDVAIL